MRPTQTARAGPGDTKITEKEWRALGVRLYGKDPRDWKFRCPACGHVQSMRDYATLPQPCGKPEDTIGYSCIGRLMETCSAAFSGEPGPCNYAGGGLFQMNPITVVKEDGTSHRAFAFAHDSTFESIEITRK